MNSETKKSQKTINDEKIMIDKKIQLIDAV